MNIYTIDYNIEFRERYQKNIIDIKILHGDKIFFNFRTFYARFYSIFVQNYNSDYYYCQLSPNCEFEIEDSTIDQRILNIILTNNIDDESAQMTKTTFSIAINEEFNNFLSKLKLNHSKVVKHSKW